MAEPQKSSPAGAAGGRPASGAGDASSGTENESRGILGRVRERAAEQLTSQKDRATEGLGTVAHAVRETTERLRSEKHETVASYIEQAANQIERFSERLRQKDVGEILEDAQNLARRQPAVFVGSAFALGLVGARFMKSSNPDRSPSGQYGYGGRYGSDEYRSRSYSGAYRGSASSTGYGSGTSGGYGGTTGAYGAGASSSGVTGSTNSELSGSRSTSTSSSPTSGTGARGARRSTSQSGGPSGSTESGTDWRKDAE
jgi:hypothetical protein